MEKGISVNLLLLEDDNVSASLVEFKIVDCTFSGDLSCRGGVYVL